MRSNGSGGGIIAAIVIVIGIIAFFVTRNSIPALFRTIGWIIVAVVGLAIIALILLIIFAARSSKNNPSGNSSSGKIKLNEDEAAVVNGGRQDLMALRRKLVTVKNSEIRTKGNAVCASMDRVFKILREKPEKIPSTRQFINYYLPTVSKVVAKYQRLEANGIPTEDMTQKIKKFLEDVNEAMDQQCTHLYEDDKLDISVNMEAMTMAIKRDGLLDDNDFVAPADAPAAAEALNETAEDLGTNPALTDDVIIPPPDTTQALEKEAVSQTVDTADTTDKV